MEMGMGFQDHIVYNSGELEVIYMSVTWKWIWRLWGKSIIEYIVGVRGNVLSIYTTWIELENIVLE